MTLVAGPIGADRSWLTGIEHRDDLAVDVDGVGDVHVPAERPADPLRDDRLAVSRRAVEKQGLTRVHRGADCSNMPWLTIRSVNPVARSSRSSGTRAAMQART